MCAFASGSPVCTASRRRGHTSRSFAPMPAAPTMQMRSLRRFGNAPGRCAASFTSPDCRESAGRRSAIRARSVDPRRRRSPAPGCFTSWASLGPLDFFVTFSSISAVWGSRGQPLYAAANHFLDALSEFRRARGLPSLAVSWGPWAEGGMVDCEDLALLARMGIAPLRPEQATDVLGRLLASGTTIVSWPISTGAFSKSCSKSGVAVRSSTPSNRRGRRSDYRSAA